MKGGRKASPWNLFVKKIYGEGHSHNSSYSFKQALKDASRRKGEMKNMGTQKNFLNNKNTKTKRNKRGSRSRRRH